MRNQLFMSQIVRVHPAEALAGTTVATAAVSLLGFDSVTFFGSMAAVTGNRISLSMSEDGVTFYPLTGAELTLTADGNLWALEVYRPLGNGNFEHVRAEIDRSGTDTALGETWAILGNARTMPVVQPVELDHRVVNAPMVATP